MAALDLLVPEIIYRCTLKRVDQNSGQSPKTNDDHNDSRRKMKSFIRVEQTLEEDNDRRLDEGERCRPELLN